MDIKTMMLTLAVGYLIFGLMLFFFQLRASPSRRIPFWAMAKILQGLGAFLLFFRNDVSDFLSITVGNSLFLIGIAYECWAIFRLSGRPVRSSQHLASAALISLVCITFPPLPSFSRLAIASVIHALFLALPGWALLTPPGKRTRLSAYLGWSFSLLAVCLSARALWAIYYPADATLFTGSVANVITLGSLFAMMLVSGFGMLLLSKETTDLELQEVLDEQAAILNTLPTGMCILRERVIVRCNPALDAMFGYEIGTLQGKSVRILYENEQAFQSYGQEIYADIQRSGEYAGEIIFLRQNGELIWAWVTGRTIFPERPEAYAVFSLADISEQKLHLETLARQQKELREAHDLLEQRVRERTAELVSANLQLEQASRMKDEFLASMSHELRTPLTGILGLSEVLLFQDDASLSDRQKTSLNHIYNSGRHLLDMINDILDYSRSGAGKLELEFKPCSVIEICQACLQTVTAQAAERGLQSSFSSDSERIMINADMRRLNQILINLLNNAIKFTPPGGSFGITVGGNQAEGQVHICVWDTGIGIRDEDLPRLFQPFIQLDASLARKYPGSGLGLALVRRLVELHGGSVSVQSKAGEGSRFTVSLPSLDTSHLSTERVQAERRS